MLSAFNVWAQTCCEADINHDSKVNGEDLGVLKREYGTFNCVACYAPVPKTGRTTCYSEIGVSRPCEGTGEDGNYQKGVTWPNPRFSIIYCDTNGPCSDQDYDCDDDPDTDLVRDNLTGLMWTRDANLPKGFVTWQEALDYVAGMNAVTGTYGYTDWRLPNRFELESLLHLEYYLPALPNTIGTGQCTNNGDPFNNVQANMYWTSTTTTFATGGAWSVNINAGHVTESYKDYKRYVWPVRGGQ